ncbi:hypothetical protein ACFQXA_24595 [Nocardiopsis composta]
MDTTLRLQAFCPPGEGTDHDHHRLRSRLPCWLDLGAADPAAAVRFYSAVFGWEADRWDEGYTILRRDGRAVAAVGVLTEEGAAPPGWSTTPPMTPTPRRTRWRRLAGRSAPDPSTPGTPGG